MFIPASYPGSCLAALFWELSLHSRTTIAHPILNPQFNIPESRVEGPSVSEFIFIAARADGRPEGSFLLQLFALID